MAKQSTFKGVIENAFGKELPTPLKYEGSFEELSAGDEVPADEQLTEKQKLEVINNKRKANERQKKMQDVLAAAAKEWNEKNPTREGKGNPYAKPTLEDAEEQFRQMVKILVTAGKSEEVARQMANQNLGTSY